MPFNPTKWAWPSWLIFVLYLDYMLLTLVPSVMQAAHYGHIKMYASAGVLIATCVLAVMAFIAGLVARDDDDFLLSAIAGTGLLFIGHFAAAVAYQVTHHGLAWLLIAGGVANIALVVAGVAVAAIRTRRQIIDNIRDRVSQ